MTSYRRNGHVLVYLDGADLQGLRSDFFGCLILDFSPANKRAVHILLEDCWEDKSTVFLAGDIEGAFVTIPALVHLKSLCVLVRGIAVNIGAHTDLPVVELGQLPRRIPDIGVYYPCVVRNDLVHDIIAGHQFSTLTESDKPSDRSLRKGVYITSVTSAPGDGELVFKLLRCSTNFPSPTEDCCSADDAILTLVNQLARRNYCHCAPLDHVLAQVYTNEIADSGKFKKARIPAHSDKTKDMPHNGLLAFVTLYDFSGLTPGTYTTTDAWDVVDKHGNSLLTRMKWKRKGQDVSVSVALYPGSVLFVNLNTNRQYTHEIVPPAVLSPESLPVRLGYVARSSKTVARHKDGQTSIQDSDGHWTPLRTPTVDDMKHLRSLYLHENASTQIVEYGHLPFSMNGGDYLPPKCAKRTASVGPGDPWSRPMALCHASDGVPGAADGTITSLGLMVKQDACAHDHASNACDVLAAPFSTDLAL